MTVFGLIIACLFGVIVGSFLNVVILRYNTGRSLAGRSGCLSCGERLSWYELFPVVSYLIQKGHCRHCHSHISLQYPLVESITGLLFILIVWRFGTNLSLLLFYWTLAAILMIITVYDLRHQIIPNLFVYLFIVLGLIKVFLIDGNLTGLIGGVVLATIFFVIWAISAGQWLGFGDIKLVLGLGLVLGLSGGLSALLLAVWIGAAIGLILIFLGRTRLFGVKKYFTMKSELPFAPFLVLGFFLNLIFAINVLSF